MDIVLIYSEGQNTLATSRLYPNHATFTMVVQRRRDSGYLQLNCGRDGVPGIHSVS